jgi:cephalosporin hydroxylase
MKDDTKIFYEERKDRILSYPANTHLQKTGKAFLLETLRENYSYNFNWLGLPIIQYPQDIVALQEIVWRTKPDMIIETGVARGGSVLLYASLLELVKGDGVVVGVDIDIRKHNRKKITKHALNHRIRLIENSSTDAATVDEIMKLSREKKRIMVSLDSNHTHEHVLKELEIYAPLVSIGCYCVVFDTIIEQMPRGSFPDRPWGKGNNPKTAVEAFLLNNRDFVIDKEIERKLIVTAAPSGYLIRCRESD